MPPADAAARVVSRPPARRRPASRHHVFRAEGLTLHHPVEELAEEVIAGVGPALIGQGHEVGVGLLLGLDHGRFRRSLPWMNSGSEPPVTVMCSSSARRSQSSSGTPMSDRAMAAGIRWATSVTKSTSCLSAAVIQAVTGEAAELVLQPGDGPGREVVGDHLAQRGVARRVGMDH